LGRSFRKAYQRQFSQTHTVLREKVREALASVLPITVIVLLLSINVAPMPTDVLLAFLVGAVLLIVGMGLFTLGADTAMLPIGERVGAHMTKSRRLWIVVITNQGYTDKVMEAARAAGATGGTAIHAKGTGTELAKKFFGVSIAEEKEIVLILTKEATRKPIMRSVIREAGMQTEAQSLAFSLPVSDLAGLRQLESEE